MKTMLHKHRGLSLGLGFLTLSLAVGLQAKPKLRTVDLPAMDARAQVPVTWEVHTQNPAVTQLVRPGREGLFFLQLIDASSLEAAPYELKTTLAPLPIDPEQFAVVNDDTLPHTLVFSGTAPGADGRPWQYYGLVRLSGFGGGASVWTLAPKVEERDQRDVAGVARRLTFKAPPRQAHKPFVLSAPGFGYAAQIPVGGFAMKARKEDGVTLVAAKPARFLDVNLVPGVSERDARRRLAQGLAKQGIGNPHIVDIPGGAASFQPLTFDGQPYDTIVFVRAVSPLGAVAGHYGVRFVMTDEDRRRALEAIFAMTGAPEPKSKAAAEAESQLAGRYLLRGAGGSSNSMGSHASSSTEQSWHFCSDRSYAYHYESVISLGSLGGSTSSDNHDGTWSVADGNNGLLLMVHKRQTAERLRYPLSFTRGASVIDGVQYRSGTSDRCR